MMRGIGITTKVTIRPGLFGIQVLCATLLLAGIPAWASGAATVTIVGITSGGAAVTTVESGSVVTLTAATVIAGNVPVTTGQVNFCDATSAYCTDIHLLGMAQLTKTGTATFKFRPGVGSHSYTAVFVGTTTNASSTSAPGDLTVTAPTLYPSFTSISQSGGVGNYSLTATVGDAGASSPTGTVSFLDTSNNNASIATASLGINLGLGFLASANHAAPHPGAAASADFNSDGIPDLAVTYTNTDYHYNVFIFLGNGDGTFSQAPQIPTPGGCNLDLLGVEDFNGDGIPDLAGFLRSYVGDPSGYIAILMGKGDGTFTPPVTQNLVGMGNLDSASWGEFNGDGIPDLAFVYGQSTFKARYVGILLGKGDGTFIKLVQTGSTIGGIYAGISSVADFNNDGFQDFAMHSGDRYPLQLTIYLSNGDGTFVPAPGSPLNVFGVVGPVADFNGDGIADLVMVDTQKNELSILLGNGNGTFNQTTGSPLAVGSSPSVVGDFNGDGIPDLVIGNSSSKTSSILLGAGDGTFSLPASNSSTVGGWVAAIADFNGDGIPDLVISNPQFEVAVQLTATQTATAAASSVSFPVATGTHQVVASYSGDSYYKPSVSLPIVLNSAIGTPSVSVAAAPNPANYGMSVILTATVSGSGLTPTGTATFLDGTTQLGTGTLDSNGRATFTVNTLALGTHSITVSYGGDANYSGVTSSAVMLTIAGMVTPSVVVTPSSSGVTSAQAFTVKVSVKGGNGNPLPTGMVTLTGGSFTSPATVLSGGTVTISVPGSSLAAGTDTLTASYAPDAASSSTYNSATGTGSILVIGAVVTVSPSASNITTAQSLSVAVTVSGGSGNQTPTGTVTLNGGGNFPASTLSGGATSISLPAGTFAAGTVTLTANYSGDAAYSPAAGTASVTVAPPVKTSFAISGTLVSMVAGAATGNTSTITVAPAGGFTGSVALTAAVTASPSGAVNPPTVSFGTTTPVNINDETARTATLTISTTATSSSTCNASNQMPNEMPWYVKGGALLGCVFLFGIPMRRRGWRAIFGMFLLLVALASGVMACGGSKSAIGCTSAVIAGTTAGTYTIAVTGTSGVLSEVSTVTLTVQ